jgi:L-iditol 2-dehydrogenase
VQCPTWRSSKIDPGGMAEYFLVSAVNQRDTLALPDSVRDLDGVLVEPSACVVKSLRRSGMRPGETIVVIGLGIMGMMHVVLARHHGAAQIIGIDLFESRAQRARELGADHGLVADNDIIERMRDLTHGAMADVVIVGPGTVRALHTGLALAGKGATVVQFTATAPDEEMTIKPHDLYFNDTRFITSYSCGPDDTRQALDLVQRGVLSASALVTHSFPLTQVSEAFATAQRQEALKVVITFEQ